MPRHRVSTRGALWKGHRKRARQVIVPQIFQFLQFALVLCSYRIIFTLCSLSALSFRFLWKNLSLKISLKSVLVFILLRFRDLSSDPNEELEASDFELEAVFQKEIFGVRSEDDEAFEEPVESEYGVIGGEQLDEFD